MPPPAELEHVSAHGEDGAPTSIARRAQLDAVDVDVGPYITVRQDRERAGS